MIFSYKKVLKLTTASLIFVTSIIIIQQEVACFKRGLNDDNLANNINSNLQLERNNVNNNNNNNRLKSKTRFINYGHQPIRQGGALDSASRSFKKHKNSNKLGKQTSDSNAANFNFKFANKLKTPNGVGETKVRGLSNNLNLIRNKRKINENSAATANLKAFEEFEKNNKQLKARQLENFSPIKQNKQSKNVKSSKVFDNTGAGVSTKIDFKNPSFQFDAGIGNQQGLFEKEVKNVEDNDEQKQPQPQQKQEEDDSKSGNFDQVPEEKVNIQSNNEMNILPNFVSEKKQEEKSSIGENLIKSIGDPVSQAVEFVGNIEEKVKEKIDDGKEKVADLVAETKNKVDDLIDGKVNQIGDSILPKKEILEDKKEIFDDKKEILENKKNILGDVKEEILEKKGDILEKKKEIQKPDKHENEEEYNGEEEEVNENEEEEVEADEEKEHKHLISKSRPHKKPWHSFEDPYQGESIPDYLAHNNHQYSPNEKSYPNQAYYQQNYNNIAQQQQQQAYPSQASYSYANSYISQPAYGGAIKSSNNYAYSPKPSYSYSYGSNYNNLKSYNSAPTIKYNQANYRPDKSGAVSYYPPYKVSTKTKFYSQKCNVKINELKKLIYKSLIRLKSFSEMFISFKQFSYPFNSREQVLRIISDLKQLTQEALISISNGKLRKFNENFQLFANEIEKFGKNPIAYKLDPFLHKIYNHILIIFGLYKKHCANQY